MDIFSTDKFSRDLHSLLVLQEEEEKRADLTLGDGASIAVIGGGPSGSFFSFFALKMAAYSTIAIETAISFKELKDVTVGLNNAVQKLHV